MYKTATKMAWEKANEGNCTINEAKAAFKSLKEDRPHLFQDPGCQLTTPLKTERDINDLRNRMAEGNYPLGMDDCIVCGLNGDCGETCPAKGSKSCNWGEQP